MDRYLIRVPRRGYFVSRIGRVTKFTYNESEAWSTDYTTEGWKIANDVCENLKVSEAYVCERKVSY